MRKSINAVLTAFCFALFATGCVKDSIKTWRTYTYYVPEYKTVDEVRANIRSGAAQPVEHPGKLYVIGNYIFLNELDRGIHVINNSNPAAPVNAAFIAIPGNEDLAVKGNALYADLYTDLVTLDIANPAQVSVKKIIDGVFPYRAYTNTPANKIITGWQRRDTTVEEKSGGGVIFFATADFAAMAQKSGAVANIPSAGIGGSMARFTIVNNYLYTVGTSELLTYNITNSFDPAYIGKKEVGQSIETIYPFRDKLYIGSATGMYMYNISSPANPVQEGMLTHIRRCDPVIADDNFAYVTLRAGGLCGGGVSQLEVLKLNGSSDPSLYKTYPLDNPYGLSKDGDLLFICDGSKGLKIYNARNPDNLLLIKQISDMVTYDVIAFGGKAIVVAKDALYQFDYSNINNIIQLSKIGITQ